MRPIGYDNAQDNQPDGNPEEEDGSDRREPLRAEPLRSRGGIGFGRAREAADSIVVRYCHAAGRRLPGDGDWTERPPSTGEAAKREQADRRATDTDRADGQAAKGNRRDSEASNREDRTDGDVTDGNPPTRRA